MINFFKNKSAKKEAPSDGGTVEKSAVTNSSLIHEPFTGAWQMNREVMRNESTHYYAVYACMSLISQDIGKLPLGLYDTDSNGILHEIERDSIADLLRRPNSYQTTKQFVESWMYSKLSRGNAYVYKVIDVGGKVTELHVLNPDLVTVLISETDQEIYYQISADSQSLAAVTDATTIPARYIIHDRMNAFRHPLIGISPLSAAGYSVGAGSEAMRTQQSFYQNKARPGGLLTTPNHISDEVAKILKQRWNDEYSGNKSGRTAILGDGLTYQNVEMMSAQDSQMIQLLEMTEKQICTAFHVPLSMLTGDSGSKSIQAHYQSYFQGCLQNHITDIETLLRDGLDTKKKIRFDVDDLMRLDKSSQIDYLDKAVGAGVMSPNEARLKLNLVPVIGGDTPYLQIQNHSLAALAIRDEQMINPPEPEPEPEEEDVTAAMLALLNDEEKPEEEAEEENKNEI
ncbi:phage portal protein [Halomonas daqingensis]|uniref:Phage portal protein n=1 Tax=Billgrantia desiderata TaxID=52021 RepID=A0AAW4YUH6_9GAMM|nr:phage portal protein [Halomonas desiderata]MCE8052283.1 phage portal protein [Halomonas desiderata]